MASEDVNAAAVALLERAVTERLNVHRRALDDHEHELRGLRSELTHSFEKVTAELAEQNTRLATVEAVGREQIDTTKSLIRGIIGTGLSVIGMAAAIIIFGGSPA